MERLTYATKGRKHKYQPKRFGVEEKFRCFEKLGQLEDIEEELGIELITLFKALKNGICTMRGFEYPTLIIDYSKDNPLGFNFLLKGQIVLFKDYGKTWALTKEELK